MVCHLGAAWAAGQQCLSLLWTRVEAYVWFAAALELVPAMSTSQRTGVVHLLLVTPHLENGVVPPEGFRDA